MTMESRLAVTIDSRGAKRNADDLSASLDRMEKAGDAAAASADGVTSSLDDQRKELAQLLGQINPTVAALGRLDDMQEKLAKLKKAGIVESDTFVEYTQRINTMRDALGETTGTMNKAGMSAKAYSAALRNVPAQFTDIAVSLQGGQAPLTVLLQQGGQLKDMFGGIGPAAQALGGYVLGLVNPFTIAASALGAFGLAAYRGYELSEQYRKALTLAGDAAGRTADDLISLSTAIASGRNFAQANQAVLSLASSGRLVGAAFNEVARAATEISVATGKSATEIADQLSNTKASVTGLAAEYSEKYGIITQAVFNQVRALEQQGQRMEAVKVLAGAVADEMGARNKEMVESTRGLAKAWDGVKTSITGAWNELKTGLSASPELFKLQHLQLQLQDARKIGDQALISGLEKQVDLAQKAVDAQSQIAKTASVEIQNGKAGIAAANALSEMAKSSRTQLEILNDEMKTLNEIRDRSKETGAFGAKEEADYAKVRKNIEQQIADIKEREAKKSAPKAVREDNRGVAEAANTFARLYAQYDPAAQAARALTKEQEQLQLALSKGDITQVEYNKALAQASINYAAVANGAKGLAAAEQYQAQVRKRLENEREGYKVEAAAIGMGDVQADRYRQRVRLEREANEEILSLQTQMETTRGAQERTAIQDQIKALEASKPARLAALDLGFAAIDQEKANPFNGWTASLQNFQTQAADVAGQTQAMFTSAFGTITSGVGSAFEKMALDGQSFGESATQITRSLVGGVTNALGQMAAQWAVNQALQLAFDGARQASSAAEIARITAETAARTSSIATTTTAKVAADGITTASSLTATATTTTAQVAAAGTTLSAWLPAALVASVGTFGAAAIVGGTALLAAFALIKGFSTGGYVSGSGTSTSDSIPARLSNGEFVVNAKATARNRELLEAINSNERVSFAGENISLSRTQAAASGQPQQIKQDVDILNNSNAVVQTRSGEDGRLEILIQAVEDRFVDQVATGWGAFPQSLEQFYALRRNAT